MGKTNKIICSFCGAELVDGEGIFVQSEDHSVCICENCIEMAQDLVDEEYGTDFDEWEIGAIERDPAIKKHSNKVPVAKPKIPTPSEMKAELDKYIIGQDHAKEIISVAVYNHNKAIKNNLDNPNTDFVIDKSNVLLIGPTGVGKTAILKALAKQINVPLAIADACGLTEAGYVGKDVDSILASLIKNANGDVSKAERGIIYIDEIDKLGRKGANPSTTKDVGGEGVQQSLLKLVEGATVEVALDGTRNIHSQKVTINTDNILFVIGGSFEGIEEQIKERLQKSNKPRIGFSNSAPVEEIKEYNSLIDKVKVEDLKNFGMIPELLGRFPVIAPLQELSSETLSIILTEPKNAIIKQFTKLFKFDNVDLEVEKEAVLAMAEKAQERKTGARALRSIVEETLHPYMFSLPDRKDITKVIITEDTVKGITEPIFILKES